MTASPHDPDSVLARPTLADQEGDALVDWLGRAVDTAYNARRLDALSHIARVLAPSIQRVGIRSDVASTLDYFLANTWNGIKFLSSPHGDWDWEAEAIEQETIYLRRAAAIDGLLEQPVTRVCQIHTNLANCYSTTGRMVDAIREWDKALIIEPRFGMARANRAVGLSAYARTLYDRGQCVAVAREAWRQLDPEELEALEPGSESYFSQMRSEIESAIPQKILNEPFNLDGFTLGETAHERAYRRWCLKHRLFLNPLNELGPLSIAARDVLTCPSIIVLAGEGPRFHDFMNQIKQEYCSARWLVYDATQQHGPHFSDRDVLLCNTLDFPSYGLWTEQLKLGFRSLYSLFDKIAFFLNAYLELGIHERAVSIKSLWYLNQQRKKGIRSEFASRENWPLRGLYWLAKDLFEDSPGFRDAMDPIARSLSDTRNHLEHKYLKLHSELWGGPGSSIFNDGLSESLAHDKFEVITMRLLEMTRAAIIYLVLGVHREERIKEKERGPDAITASIVLDNWEDDWKS